jgi:hypothetical protein
MDDNDYLFLGIYQEMSYDKVFNEFLNSVKNDDPGNYNTVKEKSKLIFAFTEKNYSKLSAFVIEHNSKYYVFENYCGNKRHFNTIDVNNPIIVLSDVRNKIVEYYEGYDKMVKKFDKFFWIKNYIRIFDPVKDPFGEENWEVDD